MTGKRDRIKALILDGTAIQRVLTRMAHQIFERNSNPHDLVLIGIRTRGVPLSQRLAAIIKRTEGTSVPLGMLDIRLYNDDLTEVGPQPVVKETEIPDITHRTVVLVDDTLYTGRTIRAAMEILLQSGRPDCIQLAVLVDRGLRELPIHADYVGKSIPTAENEIVNVRLMETDNEDQVWIGEKVRRRR